jgi:hypothetical protein
MRYGSIDANKVTTELLMLAEYLKGDELVAAAKCLYMRNNKNQKEGASVLTDEDAISGFDQKHMASSFHFISSQDLAAAMRCNTSNNNSESTVEYACLARALNIVATTCT